MFLNSRQALMNSERVPGAVSVHYLYDLSKPDVIRIQALSEDGIRPEQVQRILARAELDTIEVAKIHGWQDWLKVEGRERKVTDRFTADPLIR